METPDVVVIGAGQAGLTMSWTLRERGIDHVVLERDRVAEPVQQRGVTDVPGLYFLGLH